MNTKRNAFRAPILAIAVSALMPACATQAAPNYGTIAQYVANLVQNNHYSRNDFEDEVSKKLLDAYIGFLDSNRLYFTKVDIDAFKRKYDDTLDDYVFEGSIKPAIDIYDLYTKRVTERVAKIKKALAETEFKFDSDRTVEKRRKDSEWAADDAAADQLWLNILEGQLLEEELRLIAQRERAKELGKDLKEILGKESDSPKEKVLKRYTRFSRSLDENDEEEVCNFFMSSLAQVYDPHSEYFSQSELENFRVGMENKLVGIGALLSMEDGAAKIQGLVVGGPAHKGGELQINDRIVGVAQGEDGEMVDIMYMKLNKVVDMIRGKKGTTVVLKVIPADAADDAETSEIAIPRDEVNLKDKLANAELVEVAGPDGRKQRIGWINLYSFYADMERGTVRCSTDVRRLLDRLISEDIEGLVVDLRSNGGGSLEEAIKMTGLFIKEGPVVQAKDAKGKISDRRSENRWAVYDGPMVVLTDRVSASASEIFAAAMQDYGRAVVVGDKSSFGKGTVQTVMPVAQFMPMIFPRDTKQRAGALKVTIQKFYRIAGGSTQLKGVIPDIILPAYTDETEVGEASLPNALEYDTIRKLDYGVFENAPPVDKLRSLSEKRVGSEKEFQYIAEDNARFKEFTDRNTVSLNLETRLEENHTEKDRRRTRNTTRREHFAEVEKREKGRYKVYRMNLDNVDKEAIEPTTNFKAAEDKAMIRAEDKTKELAEKTPDFPHFLDPAKREALNVVGDLISISKGVQTAGTDPADKKPSGS